MSRWPHVLAGVSVTSRIRLAVGREQSAVSRCIPNDSHKNKEWVTGYC